jgi:F-type H+-transporting ATPase subunit gamma
MAETLERAQSRLHNISMVKPLLEALKTISLGSWQKALSAKRTSDEYRNRLLRLLPQVIPFIHGINTKNTVLQDGEIQPKSSPRQLIIIGSERGLCGNFNKLLAQRVVHRLKEMDDKREKVEVTVYGNAAYRACLHEFGGRWKFAQKPMPGVAPANMAWELSESFLSGYDQGEFSKVELFSNAENKGGRYKPVKTDILPPRLPDFIHEEPPWPEAILDTDPLILFLTIARQLAALDLYTILLSSAIAEHTERFQLMEEASRNADDLIEELTQDVQAARRQAITNEMEELAVGAGLL